MVCASWQHAMNSALRCVCRSDWTQKCPVNPKPADLTQVLVSIKLFSRDHACQCNAEGSFSEPGISVPQPLAAEGVSNPDSHHAFSGSFTDGARESDFGCQFRRFGPHYISEGETFVSFLGWILGKLPLLSNDNVFLWVSPERRADITRHLWPPATAESAIWARLILSL